MNVSSRPEYLDTIGDLCDAFYGNTDAYRVVWEVRFLVRDGRWFHFYGASRSERGVSVNRRSVTRLRDPIDATSVAIAFARQDPRIKRRLGSRCFGTTPVLGERSFTVV